MLLQDSRMNGEIVNTLFCLLNQRVAVELPGERFGLAPGLFKRLLDGHCSDRDRGVSQNPLAGLMDIGTGTQIHNRISPPAA